MSDLSLEKLLTIFESYPGHSLSVRDIMEITNTARGYRKMVLNILKQGCREDRLVQVGAKRFMLRHSGGVFAGKVQVNRQGNGFLLTDEGEDLYIHRSNLGSTLDGDEVEAESFIGPKGRREGRVRKVTRRAHEMLAGQLERRGRGGIVFPRNNRLSRVVEVLPKSVPADAGKKPWVMVKILEWSNSPEEPLVGEVVEVLGKPGDEGLGVLALLRDMGVETDFPSTVIEETEKLPAPVTPKERERRLDLTRLPVCTIDPATAKDFDDALSVESLGKQGWRLGVHIADVAEYVREETALDQEALRRGTSIYPVDRVVPMLPERLSNDLCSLRPREERYALSVFMDINRQGEVEHYDMAESVIFSHHRFSYEEVQDYLNSTPEARKKASFHEELGKCLLALRDLARCLYDARMARGALDLDMPEAEADCDETGRVLDLYRKERLESHRIVESCMLVANETVARHTEKGNLPNLYRIHQWPDPGGLEKLGPAMAAFGVKIPKKVTPSPEFYQEIVERLQRLDGGHIPQRLLLSSLMRAEYSPQNAGHFGLASPCYCHFTSPIRRYPDLLTHRVIKAELQGKTLDLEKWEKQLPAWANQSNLKADEAESMERSAMDIKAAEFMQEEEGGVFEAWIGRIGRRGFWVELVDFPVQGMVAAEDLHGDYFAPNESFTALVGRHSGVQWRLGRRIRVQLTRVRVMEGLLDFIPLPEGKKGGGKKGRRKKRRG